MGWPAKSDKTRNSRLCDVRIVSYKKLENENLRYQKFIWLTKILQNSL